MPSVIIVAVLILADPFERGSASIWCMSLPSQPDDHLVYTGGQLGGGPP
jgi:hypothetical protein